ncbi:hypothetical protein NBO_28g0004 [Nosema bombycis CQ1]|uniref:Uncharacterized protein n=1 Tax=Nosema bombycis (strain CQ1 / CVCC 102059) TaxID=578461 RepID=R0MJI8_NOSB1|nr:hypothetical protein NBO_28g0004 [Nosema bombycis CQ1]|eukprot:EOB14365.1 hypothetical protein NBO_28g0004 [Nosema bombycis CQ1]
MIITHLQSEVNHLIFLYFTTIGVLQRDADSPEIDKIKEDLLNEVKKCLERTKKYSEMNIKEVKVSDKLEFTLNYAKDYLSEGYEFLDWLIE